MLGRMILEISTGPAGKRATTATTAATVVPVPPGAKAPAGMNARPAWRLFWIASTWLLALAISTAATTAATAAPPAAAPARLISLNPSLTAIVLRLGGIESLVGVDDF
jgi:endonuclease/exonuclease/phosphatase (EEP) superfamily protein YafD